MQDPDQLRSGKVLTVPVFNEEGAVAGTLCLQGTSSEDWQKLGGQFVFEPKAETAP